MMSQTNLVGAPVYFWKAMLFSQQTFLAAEIECDREFSSQQLLLRGEDNAARRHEQ